MPALLRAWVAAAALAIIALSVAALRDVSQVVQEEPQSVECGPVPGEGWWALSNCQGGLVEAVMLKGKLTVSGFFPGQQHPVSRAYVPVWRYGQPPPEAFGLFVEVTDAATLRLMAALRAQEHQTLAQMAVTSNLARIQATLRTPVGMVGPLEGEAADELTRIYGPRVSVSAQVLRQGSRPQMGRSLPLLVAVLVGGGVLGALLRARRRASMSVDLHSE